MQNDSQSPIRVRIKDRAIVEETQTKNPVITGVDAHIDAITPQPQKKRYKRRKKSTTIAQTSPKIVKQTAQPEKKKSDFFASSKKTFGEVATKIKQAMKKFIQFARLPHTIKNWILLAVIVAAIIFPMGLWISNSMQHAQLTQQYGMFAKLRELKQSHDYYTSMATKDELLVSWVKMFSNWRYKTGGDPRYNTGDCVGAVHQFLLKWESNVAFEDVNSIIQRCKNLEERGEIQKRSNPFSVKHGDLIIFNFGVDIPKHIGVVYDCTNGWVRYMDVNAVTGTWGFEKVKWGAGQVHAIYEVSFSLWTGNLIKDLNKK